MAHIHALSEFECSGLCTHCPDENCQFRDKPYGSQCSIKTEE